MQFMKVTDVNYAAVAQFAEANGFESHVDGPGTLELKVTATGDRVPARPGQYVVIEDGALRVDDTLPPVLDRCDPATGHHADPHVGCILR